MDLRPDTPGVDDPGSGKRLGLDVGTVRIGVAVSDRDARMAMPVETVSRATKKTGGDGADIDRLVAIAEEYGVVEIVVGLPRTLKNRGSSSIDHAHVIATRLAARLPDVPVRFADERLSTVVAQQALRTSGVSSRGSRAVIDQAAAVEILQSWLDGRTRVLTAQATEEVPNP